MSTFKVPEHLGTVYVHREKVCSLKRVSQLLQFLLENILSVFESDNSSYDPFIKPRYEIFECHVTCITHVFKSNQIHIACAITDMKPIAILNIIENVGIQVLFR